MLSSGYGVLHTTDSGATWSAQSVPAASTGFGGSIACASASVCESVGQSAGGSGSGGAGGIIGTTDGRTTRSVQSIPATTTGLGDVSCPTTQVCVAAGSDFALPTADGVVLTTSDGGAIWTNGTLPGTGNVNTLSCPTTLDCVALAGNQVLASTDGAVTWAHQSVPSSAPYYPESLACASATICEIVGSSAGYTTNGGTTWTEGALPAPVAPATGYNLGVVSCPSTTSAWPRSRDRPTPLSTPQPTGGHLVGHGRHRHVHRLPARTRVSEHHRLGGGRLRHRYL